MTKRLQKGAEFSKTINDDPMKKNLILLKILIQCGCIWPETDNRILIIIGCINVASIALINLCQIYDAIINTEHISIQSTAVCVGLLQATIKSTTLIMHRKKLRAILYKIWLEFLPIKAAAGRVQVDLNNLANLNLKIICYLLVIISGATFQFLALEWIKGKQELPFPLYFMPKSSPLHEMIYMWQFHGGVFCSIIGSSVDFLFVALVLICVAQFQIINSNLKLVGSVDEVAISKFITRFSLKDQKYVDRYLVNKFVVQHDMLTKTCLELAKVFQYIMLCQVLTTTMTACFSSFAMTQNPELMFQYFPVPFLIFLQLLFYCWFSEQLTYHAGESAASAYECAWYNLNDLKLKKNLILIIQSSNKEIAMTAGGFWKMNLNTLVQVSKYFVSIYTLMKKVMKATNL